MLLTLPSGHSKAAVTKRFKVRARRVDVLGLLVSPPCLGTSSQVPLTGQLHLTRIEVRSKATHNTHFNPEPSSVGDHLRVRLALVLGHHDPRRDHLDAAPRLFRWDHVEQADGDEQPGRPRLGHPSPDRTCSPARAPDHVVRRNDSKPDTVDCPFVPVLHHGDTFFLTEYLG
jgi:hypothetical protein